MTYKKDTNDFDFEDSNDFNFDFVENENLTDEELKERADREVARFKEEQEHKRTVDAAYDKILGRLKAAPTNDQAHYEAFKAERLERFKTLDIVVDDICKKYLDRDNYQYDSFKNELLSVSVSITLINRLSDIIQRIIYEQNGDGYEYRGELSKEQQFAIKALSIAIIDLAEGNI
jgi:hypothetical protein